MEDTDAGDDHTKDGQRIEKVQIEGLMKITPDGCTAKADCIDLICCLTEEVLSDEFHISILSEECEKYRIICERKRFHAKVKYYFLRK